MEKSNCSWSGGYMAAVVLVLLSVVPIVVLSKPRDDFQSSNCASLCPSSDSCTVSQNGTVTCIGTDGSDSFSGSISSSSGTAAGSWSMKAFVILVFLMIFMPCCCCCFLFIIPCNDLVTKCRQSDLYFHDVFTESKSHLIGGEHSCATDQLKTTALDDEKQRNECHAADDLDALLLVPEAEFGNTPRHLGPQITSLEQRFQVNFGRPAPGNTAPPKYETERHREFCPGQNSHRFRARRLAWQPLPDLQSFSTHPQFPSSPISDIPNHIKAAGSLATNPDGEAPLPRRHIPTGSSHIIATHNTAEPPVGAPRPSTARTERSFLFAPEIIVVPDEIMMSSNASKLFRRCTRLHDSVESLMELDIISPQLCCQVTAECQSHGNMSGLALLYRQVKQAGNEDRFLAALRAHRKEIVFCTSSIGSDEAGSVASMLSETSSSSSSANSLDSASAISLLNGHETLMWVRALDKLEDLICEGILTVYQYAYIVDLALHDWRISALMQIVKGCRKLTRLQRFLATPPASTPTPPRRGSPHGAATAAGAGRNHQQ